MKLIVVCGILCTTFVDCIAERYSAWTIRNLLPGFYIAALAASIKFVDSTAD